VPFRVRFSFVEAMNEARTIGTPRSVEETVSAITFAAKDNVPHADHASISLVDRHGTMHTLVPTDKFVVDADRLQCELARGPAWTPRSGHRWCPVTTWPVTSGDR
jgi:hypothetical protein